MDPSKRRAVAIWRMNILGPLVSARLEHGDRRELLEEAASRTYETVDGCRVRFAWRTLEGWYHAYKVGGLDALEPHPRADRGACKAIPDELARLILELRREQPRRSVRILIRTLERAGLVGADTLKVSTVVRLLRAHGLSQRPRVLPERERRAFTVPLPGDLWVGDAMHGPPVIGPDGAVHTKAYLLSQIDVASRFLINSDFYLHEDAGHQEDGLRRAIVGHGLPREYYVDRGPAYIAESLRTICAELGIHLLHAGPGDAAAKGVIERFHKTWRAPPPPAERPPDDRPQEVRRRRDGSERTLYIVDIKLRRPDGGVVRVRKVSPLQTLRAAKALEHDLRERLLADLPLAPGDGPNAPEAPPEPPEPPKVPTLAEFVPEFMRFQASPAASRRGANKPGELREKQRLFDNHLLPAFGAVRLDQITARMIDGYVAARSAPAGAKHRRPVQLGEPLAPATLANHLTLLRRVLSVAHRWELIPRIPTFTCTPPPGQRLDFLTFDEAERLLAAADPAWRPLLLLAIRTGLRLGEIRALRWQDVRLEEGYLRVERSLTRAGYGTPKSGKARTVELAPDLLGCLRALARPPGPEVLVFGRPNGDPLSQGQIYRAPQAAAQAAGLGRPVYPHMLRHTFASHCVMRGIPLAIVKEWLGHSDTRVTERYAHLAPQVRSDFIQRLG